MKYVILIHSNPRPWGHPTGDYNEAFQALPREQRDAMSADFERLLNELSERGELVAGEALGDAANARLYRWRDGKPLATDGPYSEAKEHLAGFFLLDVESPERAEELAAQFASPGDTIELRATMWPGCEDAAQEAFEAAARQWGQAPPDNPRGWLIRVASRRLIDRGRADAARAGREEAAAEADTAPEPVEHDDSLELLLLCCHPALSRPSQVALTLRVVCGLGASAIAAAFLVPEPAMAQRLSRARATLRAAGARFELPAPEALPQRVAAVLDVLHLVFNEGYTRTAGDDLLDASLTREAIRLTRELHRRLPDHHEVAGALALMLLTRAPEAARTGEHGELIPLAEQDRGAWSAGDIAEGVAILERVLPRGPVGRFQLQAAIAAVHAEASAYEDTDWEQIHVLYEMLERQAPSPAVTLNRAVAVGMARGPEQGLEIVDGLLRDARMARHHRTHAVRAHLLELTGDPDRAAEAYARAAGLTASLPEQRYLNARAARVACRP